MEYDCSLSQKEVFRFGESLLKDIEQRYRCLINDPDWFYQLEEDIDLFKKLSLIIVRLQSDRKLVEEEDGIDKSSRNKKGKKK